MDTRRTVRKARELARRLSRPLQAQVREDAGLFALELVDRSGAAWPLDILDTPRDAEDAASAVAQAIGGRAE